MMGERLVMQESLFYEFRLEDHVPCDYLLRRIDCSELRQHLVGYYSTTADNLSADFVNAIGPYQTSAKSHGGTFTQQPSDSLRRDTL